MSFLYYPMTLPVLPLGGKKQNKRVARSAALQAPVNVWGVGGVLADLAG